MDQGEKKQEEQKEPDPSLPPAGQSNQLDSDNNFIMINTDKDNSFLKYLEPEYKKHLVSPDLSDVITVERQLGNPLFAIQNN